MVTILKDIVVIVFGVVLIQFRHFYAELGLPKAKTLEEKARMATSRMYQIKVWNALIVGAGFILLGVYWLYMNWLKP